MVSKDRLLEYRVGEGWERLCEFLDVPVPDYDFPLANEQEAFGDRFHVMIGMAVQRCLIKCCSVLGGIVAVGVAASLYRRK